MGKKHHNLNGPQERYLINTLTANDFGIYTDSITGKNMLVWKKHGFSIPFSGTHGQDNPVVLKNCTSDGQARVVGITLDDVCPCDECGSNYGILIRKTPKAPGKFNSLFPISQKPYGGKITKPLQCVSGLIPDAIMTEMVDDIINQVNGDVGVSDPNSGAGAIAGYMYKLTTATAWDVTSNITINGGAAVGTATTAADFVSHINTSHDAYAFVDPTNPLLDIWIMAKSTPTTFAIATSAGTIALDTTLYIGLISTNVDIPIDVFISDVSNVTGTMVVVQAGYFASITPEDVFAIFANMGHHGELANNIYQDKPVKDAHYCKYTFMWEGDIDSLNSGASQYEHYDYSCDLYIKGDQVDDDRLFDADKLMADTTTPGFTGDITFDQFLGVWGYNPTGGGATITLSDAEVDANGFVTITINNVAHVLALIDGETVAAVGAMVTLFFQNLGYTAYYNATTRVVTILGGSPIVSLTTVLTTTAAPTFTAALT